MRRLAALWLTGEEPDTRLEAYRDQRPPANMEDALAIHFERLHGRLASYLC